MIIYNFNRETESGYKKYRDLFKLDSWLFKAIEKQFDDFMDDYGDRSELREMYESDEAIYSKKGAIHQAIEELFDYMDEEGLKSTDLNKFDLEGIFQGNYIH